jgi:hypothetical protein
MHGPEVENAKADKKKRAESNVTRRAFGANALKDPFETFSLDPPLIFSARGAGRRYAPPPAKRARYANAPKVLC